MAFTILEWFGRLVGDKTSEATELRRTKQCPFIKSACTKLYGDGSVNSVCSVDTSEGPLVICPNRLYAESYKILKDASLAAFGPGMSLVFTPNIRKTSGQNRVLALGKRSGGEIKLPTRGKRGSYFVDWILAKLTEQNELAEFVALEVQTMDTTGSYRPEVEKLQRGAMSTRPSKSSPNWENVNKRILPQLIYKGHVLRRENKCAHGLFFVCPELVLTHIKSRLGGTARLNHACGV